MWFIPFYVVDCDFAITDSVSAVNLISHNRITSAVINGYNPFIRSNNSLNPFIRDQARGRLGRNSRPRGQNFALNGTQGEVGVSLKKKKN